MVKELNRPIPRSNHGRFLGRRFAIRELSTHDEPPAYASGFPQWRRGLEISGELEQYLIDQVLARTQHSRLAGLGTEQEKAITVECLQEMDLSRHIRWIEHYLRLLQYPDNRQHFTNVPKSLDKFLEDLAPKSVHPFAAINGHGNPVGFTTGYDAEPAQHDHFIGKTVVETNLQTQTGVESPHVGGQMLEMLLETMYIRTKTHDGRPRKKISAAVVNGVENSERAKSLFMKHGFRIVANLPVQADVILKSDLTATKDVTRLEQTRADWLMRRYFETLPLISST